MKFEFLSMFDKMMLDPSLNVTIFFGENENSISKETITMFPVYKKCDYETERKCLVTTNK